MPACLTLKKGEEVESGQRPNGQRHTDWMITADIWIKRKQAKPRLNEDGGTQTSSKSVRGRRWLCCGGVRRLPQRQHVIGSIFKRIRQAEKKPPGMFGINVGLRSATESFRHKTAAKCQSGPKETCLSSLCLSETQLSCLCQLSLKLTAWCDVTSTDRAQSGGWQHVQPDTCHLPTWP